MLHICNECGKTATPSYEVPPQPDGQRACTRAGCTGTQRPLTETMPSTAKMKHPVQPVGVDKDGVVRFKRNAIVEFLLDTGGTDMNKLARMEFSDEDFTQFAQLIGYSVSGAGELPYFAPAALALADQRADALMSVENPKLSRASGNVACLVCGHPYRKHPHTQHRTADDTPWLRVLCDGRFVKL